MRKSNLEKVRAVLEKYADGLEEKADGDVYVDGMADGVRFAMDIIDEEAEKLKKKKISQTNRGAEQ